MIVTINGADGSGKSTILNAMTGAIQGEHTQKHSRPGNISPKTNTEKQNRYVDRPGAVPKRRVSLQLAKIVLFMLEFQTFAIWHKITARRKLVILERSLVDLYVHPARYGLETWLVDRLRPVLVDWYADLNICLTGDPEKMAARKQELQATEIARLNERYQEATGRSSRKQLLIDTTRESIDVSRERMIARLNELSHVRIA